MDDTSQEASPPAGPQAGPQHDGLATLEVTMVEQHGQEWRNFGTLRVLTDQGQLSGNAVVLDEGQKLVALVVPYNGTPALNVSYWSHEQKVFARNKVFDISKQNFDQRLEARLKGQQTLQSDGNRLAEQERQMAAEPAEPAEGQAEGQE